MKKVSAVAESLRRVIVLEESDIVHIDGGQAQPDPVLNSDADDETDQYDRPRPKNLPKVTDRWGWDQAQQSKYILA